MMKKVTAAALFLLMAFLPLTGYAAGNDNATALPEEKKSSTSGDPSYFEGVWVGSWPGWKSTSISMDVTVEIRRKKKAGVFGVIYSWEGGPSGSGFPPLPGSIKSKGKVEGDTLTFGWTNKAGREMKATLKKLEENRIKAMMEKSGPTGSNERPFNETTLNRK